MPDPRLRRGQAVAVTLSGGGTRLYGHAGVLAAVEEAGLVVKEITGVSGGALVGTAYCCLGLAGMQTMLRGFDIGQALRFGWFRNMGLYTNRAIADTCRAAGVTWEKAAASGIGLRIGVTALEPSLGLVWSPAEHPLDLELAEAVRMSAAIPLLWGYTQIASARVKWPDDLPADAVMPQLVTVVDGGVSRMMIPGGDLPWIASDVATSGYPAANPGGLTDYLVDLLGALQYRGMEMVMDSAAVAVRHVHMRTTGWLDRFTPDEVDAIVAAAKAEAAQAIAAAMA